MESAQLFIDFRFIFYVRWPEKSQEFFFLIIPQISETKLKSL